MVMGDQNNWNIEKYYEFVVKEKKIYQSQLIKNVLPYHLRIKEIIFLLMCIFNFGNG
jgi:hypothetical protein